MLRNYLTTALRALRRQWGYAALNVAGLGVGMAVCLLIGLYVHAETQVDRFHAHADRIVQVGFELWGGRSTATPYPLAAALEAGVPGVQQAVRTLPRSDVPVLDTTGLDGSFRALYTEPAFFEVFTFPAVRGDAAAALAAPDGLVLTERLAALFFGEADPLGRTLRVGRGDEAADLTVRAVVRDVPEGSTTPFDLVAPVLLIPENQRPADGWSAYMYSTYALLTPGTSAADVEARLPDLLRPHHEGDPPAAFAIPLPEVYLSDLHTASGFRGRTRYLYVFGSAALLVLLIAGINYVNLATAQGLGRAREVGVRKALGAGRAQVARQFFAESVVLSGLALLLALALVGVAFPGFNSLFGTALTWGGQAGALAALAAFGVGVGVLAGAYPALVLARFDPVRALRQQARTGAGGGWLRSGLVVVQFGASSVLLIGTAVIASQLSYMQTKDLGFSGEQVVAFDLRSQSSWEAQDALRQAALAHPAVVSASVAGATPGQFRIGMGFTRSKLPVETVGDPDEMLMFRPARVDPHYVQTLGLRLIAGRDFDPDRTADLERAFLINETTARRLGWTPEEALGQPFTLSQGVDPGEVIGVVADFHTASLHGEIPAVGLQLGPSPNWSTGAQLVARLAPEDIPGTMRHLETALRPFAADGPLRYEFLDERFDALYASERNLGRIFGTFALMAVGIACLGLLGLAAHTAQARTKEIGIRKVLGATAGSLVALLTRDFVGLVALAFVIAAPVAYLLMGRWLEDFAYRVEIGPGVFLTTAGLALGLALLTVGALALRAANADPVKSLRSE